MKAIDRLYIYLDSQGIKPTVFEREIGLSSGYLSNMKKRSADIGESVLNKVIDNSHFLSAEWLLTGNGEMLRSKQPITYPENDSIDSIDEDGIRIFSLKTDHTRSMQRIPLYDFEAVAGLVPLYNDTAKQVPIDYIQIPNLPKCDGAIHVVGDSMYPLLKSGDIVLYKWVSDVNNGIFWGEMYLVSVDFDSEEYVTVKYIQKSDQEGYIKLVSYNQHHGDKEIPVGTIRALAFVKASIRINSMK